MSATGIMEVKIYMDEKGRTVKQFRSAFGQGKPDCPPPFYKGTATVKVTPMHPATRQPMPPQIVPLEFPFPEGTGLQHAFDTFDEEAKKNIDEQMKEMNNKAAEASRIVAARATAQILGANGKTINMQGK